MKTLEKLENEVRTALRRVNRYASLTAGAEHRVGELCAKIRDSKLYRAAGFTSWEAYAATRFGLTYSTVNLYIRLARSFTRAEAEQMGPSRSRVLLSLPPEAREKLKPMALRKEVTVRDLKNAVRAEKTELGLSTLRPGEGARDWRAVHARLSFGPFFSSKLSRSGPGRDREAEFEIGRHRFKVMIHGDQITVSHLRDLADEAPRPDLQDIEKQLEEVA